MHACIYMYVRGCGHCMALNFNNYRMRTSTVLRAGRRRLILLLKTALIVYILLAIAMARGQRRSH